MNKDSKSIFKMQEAGSIPEVNQYGLTEEQMQSVRDNMRLYKISEEEAVANKIKAMETSSDYWQKDAMLFDIKNSQRYLNDTMANAKNNISSYSALNYKPISFNPNDRLKDWSHINLDPNWRIKILMDLGDRNRVLGAQQRESKAYADWVIESSKDRNAQQNVLAENAASRLKWLNNGLYSRQNDYNTYKQEFLDSNPIGNYTKSNWRSELQSPTHMGGAIEDPTTVREQDAHNYAVSKIRDQYKDTNNNSYLSNYWSNYFTGEDLKNQYAANLLQKDSPFIRHSKSLQNVGDTALTAGATTLPLYLFAPEFATYKLAAIPRIAGEFAGAKIGEKLFSRAGRAIDQMRAFNRTRTGIRLGMEDPASYKPITSPAYIADKLAQRVGEPLDKIWGKETVSPWIRNAGNWLDSYEKVGHFLGGFWGWNKGEKAAYGLEKLGWASILNKPWARKLPQWVVPNALKQDTFNTLLKYNMVHPKMKTTFVNDYQFLPNSSKPLLPSSTNSKNIIKNQLGGLVYKPYIPEQNESKQTSSTTLSYEPEESDNESFQVEPVKIYTQTTQNIVSEEPEIMKQSIIEQETPVQVDNTRVQKPVEESKGKIYKSTEKEKFKEDVYNAYFRALMQKGLDESKASEFAKRLTTQDILESNWGQSSLSKDFNFGGIKDFSGNGTVKDTTEVVDGKSVKVKQPFRKFANIDEYVNYKINLVDKKWKVFGFNPDKYYSLIVSGKQKYATDPNYVSKLNKLYKLIWK